ncbi:MAG: MBL fold metallo-hydrolase [Clostridia bacterium]|nr:MBL fold metallo-hydrolase [Clostridia bacterium]
MAKDFIHFFGTTGNKDIFFKNIRQAGGLFLNIDDTKLIIDPGVNTFYKYIHTYKDELDGIVLSHIHIDHSNDLNIFVELMTNGGELNKGTLLLPNQAIEENVLQPYVRNFPKEFNIINPNTQYKVKNISIISSIEHKHGVENYGFIFKTSKGNIGLVTDTAYFPELLESYKNSDILIMNVPYYIQNKPKPKHLDISNVEEFIKNIKPRKVILTHFNSNILNNNPVKIADELRKKYSTEIIIAKDDMVLDI